MEAMQHCPDCGAAWADGLTCEQHFHQMAAWELEHAIYDVHHLLVLCYHLQHPRLYSPSGLAGALRLLVDFVVLGMTPQQVRQRDRAALDSGRRRARITGTPDSHGSYDPPVHWTTTVPDVTAGGVAGYSDRVRAWAQTVFDALNDSGNLL
ncbi:MAG: hypothetical protein JW910_14065 [Anaerolineae bacterium]|nr:hypothetical protein [Anaerolineae bacterium]